MFARQIATMSNLPSEKKQKSKRKEGIILRVRECASVPKRLREFIIGHVANRIIFIQQNLAKQEGLGLGRDTHAPTPTFNYGTGTLYE